VKPRLLTSCWRKQLAKTQEEQGEEKEVAEDETTFPDPVKVLEAARK
jgi:hypothetical protein